MNCLADDVLRAYMDHELESADYESADYTEIENHLAACALCRSRSQSFSATASRVKESIATLDGSVSVTEANPQIALARFKANLDRAERPGSLVARVFAKRWRLVWALSVAAALLVVSLLFPAGRSFAQRLLATLRIEKVQTVTLDLPAMNDSNFDQRVQQALSQIVSKDVVVTLDEKPQTANSRQQANTLAGFPVRLLSARADTPQLHVEGAHAFHMTIDRSRLQDILDQAGRPDLLLPATLEGATLSVQIPRAVAAAYGSCPNHNKNNEVAQDTLERKQSMMRGTAGPSQSTSGEDCVILLQAPSPVVNVPSDLNLQQLAEIAMEFAGMSEVQARQFCQTIDWKSTLVLPVPPSIRSYETVSVDGVQGTLMKTGGHHGGSAYVLIWVKDGVIYSLVNNSDDANSAVQLASTLE